MIHGNCDEPHGLGEHLRLSAISHFVPLFDFEREYSPSFIGGYYVEN